MHWQDATDTTLHTLLEQPRLGLITDVDGTISPIVAHPDDAQVTPRNREMLDALQDVLTLVAVISGRAADDISQRVGIPGLVYVGNHGLETWIDGEVTLAPQVHAYRPGLEIVRDALTPRILPGMIVEDKGATLSIHYRRAEDPARGRRPNSNPSSSSCAVTTICVCTRAGWFSRCVPGRHPQRNRFPGARQRLPTDRCNLSR